MRSGALLLVAGCVLVPAMAAAHSFDPALLDLREQRTGVFAVRWRTSPAAGEAHLRPHLPERCRRLEIAGGSGDSAWQIDCGSESLYGAALRVDGLEATPLDVVVRITWLDGVVDTGVLAGGAGVLRVRVAPSPPVTTGAALGTYVLLGVTHILRGTDHLLFLFGLMLLVGGGAGFRSGQAFPWHNLLKTITAFTVAHSLTLALAALGLVRLPVAPVEALIALSIVFLAAELVGAARREAAAATAAGGSQPWMVAFAFGLLHGLGFAGALFRVGLPQEQMATALLAFNAGVELGQVAFVAALIVPLLALARAARRWAPARLLPAYAIGALAMMWTLERIQLFWAVPR